MVRNCHSNPFVFQKEISAMLEPLTKQLRKLNKTKEQWEDTRTYIQVHVWQQRVFQAFTFDRESH